MRLTVTICFILNLHLISHKVSAGYSDMVLNGPLPKLEDYSDGGDGGTDKEQKSDYGDGENGQRSVHATNRNGDFRSSHDVQEEGKTSVRQRKAKSAGAEGQVVFGRKRHGRFEYEDGERYEESGDSGDGRERNWFVGKGDGNGEVDESEQPNQRHHGTNYEHRRRKNYSQLQRSKKLTGNKVDVGDLSRFKKIHKKHFGGGGGEGNEGKSTGNGKPKFNQNYNNQRRVKKLRLEEESESIDE